MNILTETRNSIRSITLDESSLIRRAEHIEAERQTAIADLIAANAFTPHCVDAGPYDVFLSVRDNRLLFRVSSEELDEPRDVILSLKPFKRIIKDYFLMCDSYFQMMHSNQTHRLEAIDMGRRGIHNEGSELLQDQLKERITLDFDTARRLFTLICVLHIR